MPNNDRGANAATLAQGLGFNGGETLRHLMEQLWLSPTEAKGGERQRRGTGKQRSIRYAATLNLNNGSTLGGGKGGRKSDDRSIPAPPVTARCAICSGFHTDLRTCPNGLAKQDTSFVSNPGTKCGWKTDGKHTCDGEGHYARHHRQQWIH